jgi:RNA-directed DNA polymerase
MNLSRGDGGWRDDTKPALDNLMERIFAHENVARAWSRVKSNRGVAGVDGMTIDAYPAYAEAHWERIRQPLMDGRYQPQPVRRVAIPKPKGGERLLGIPCVVDRVIQQAILQVLSPIFEDGFSNSSYGSRPKRSAHGAIQQLKSDIKAGYRIAVDIDLEKFFDNVDHDKLMSRVSRKVTDKVLLGLIGRYL